jgi:hypothetical protein
MTKKHYEAIASIIANKVKNPSHNKITLYVVATEMSHYFQNDNPKFNRARFLTACGINPTE